MRIPNLIFGAYDEKNGAVENGIRLYNINNYYKPNVYGGILEDKCSELLKNFFKKIRNEK